MKKISEKTIAEKNPYTKEKEQTNIASLKKKLS
jgi:hypothetical protein